MRSRGATFVPHLYAFEQVVGESPDQLTTGTMHWIPDAVLRRLHEIRQQPPSALRAYRAGIRIAVGSDTGVIPRGDDAGELEALVRMGMPPAAALGAVTIDAARALRIDDRTGPLAPGKSADLFAVRGSPLADISAVREPVYVMARGHSL